MEQTYDVVILGGGPGGSAAATILAKRGRRVLVLERERFPRFKIGESLLPGSMECFDRLGVREKLEQRFIIKHGAEIATVCGTHSLKFYFKEGLDVPSPTAFHVIRAEFDQILLDHARECGAETYEEATVTDVQFDGEGATVEFTRNGQKETARGLYVLDATGRNSFLGQKFGLRQPYPGLNKFSVFAHYENVDRAEGIDGSLIRVIRGRDRWFWMIPLTPSRMSIGVVMDTSTFKKARKTPEQFLEEAIAEQPVIMERMSRAVRVTEVHAAGDYSYRNSRLSGERWLLVGDSAGFIDPVFSTGVFMSLLSGERAAEAVNIVLTTPQKKTQLFQAYEKNCLRVMEIYLKFVKGWYTQEFIEVFVSPERRLGLPKAINSILAGNMNPSWRVRWRLMLFYLVVKIQQRWAICPRLDLTPGVPKRSYTPAKFEPVAVSTEP